MYRPPPHGGVACIYPRGLVFVRVRVRRSTSEATCLLTYVATWEYGHGGIPAGLYVAVARVRVRAAAGPIVAYDLGVAFNICVFFFFFELFEAVIHLL